MTAGLRGGFLPDNRSSVMTTDFMNRVVSLASARLMILVPLARLDKPQEDRMFKIRIEFIIASVFLLTTSLACSSTRNIVNQPTNISINPTTTTLVDCSVTQDLSDSDSAWAKFDEEYYWFLNIIQTDTKGRIWLATDGHGLLMYDGKEWHNWQPESRNDMSYDALRTMAISNDRIYAGAYGSAEGGNLLVYDIQNDQWETIFPGTNTLRDNVIGGLAINQLGQVYVMTRDGLDVFSNDSWTYASNPLESDFAIHSVDDALFDNEENYWVAMSDGVWRFDGKTWISYTAISGQLPNSVNALDIDHDGRIWAATRSGLAVYSNGEWFVFSPDKFPWYQGWLHDVTIDSKNRVWVVSNDVLSVFNGKEVVLFTPDAIGESLWGDAIGFDNDGCAWIGMSLGLSVFRGNLDLESGNFDFLK